jgi:hypothetical protein
MPDNVDIPPEVTEARLRITEDELRAGEELSSLLTDDEVAALHQRLTPELTARLDKAVRYQRRVTNARRNRQLRRDA